MTLHAVGDALPTLDFAWRPQTQAEVKEAAFEALRAHLRHAVVHSTFLQKSICKIGTDVEAIQTIEDFYRTVPFFAKPDLIADMEENAPYGSLLTCPLEEINRVFVAPGPILQLHTRSDYHLLAGYISRAFHRMGLRPRDLVDNSLQYNWIVGGSIFDEAARLLGCATLPGGSGMTKQHVENMRLTRATAFLGFTTFAEHVGQTALEMGLDPRHDLRLRLLLVGGEMRAPNAKERLEEIFGAKVLEFDMNSEVGAVAYECGMSPGMHVMDHLVVEVIDPQTGAHVPSGQPGELVVTETFRRAVPIIRCRTWDLTEGLEVDPCPCGMPTPRLRRFFGRVGDIPRVKGIFVNPREVGRALARFPECGRFQVHVSRPGVQDILSVRVEAPSATRPGLEQRLREAIRDEIRLAVEIEWLDPGSLPDDHRLVIDERA